MKVLLAVGSAFAALILIVLLFPTVTHGPDATPKARAKSDVVTLKTAMQFYLSEYDTLPQGNNPRLLKVLQGDNPKKIVFIEPSKKQISEDGFFIDSWGSPYVFGTTSLDYPWAYSIGKNKIDEGGTGDDINSWN